MKRREFVRTASLGAVAMAYEGCGSTQPVGDSMTYRTLGKTGMDVSRLSFGSHLTKENMADPGGRDRQIQLGIELGINLFDIYDHSYQQFAPMSKSLDGHSDVLISLYMDSTDVEKRLDEVLRIFGRDHIDLYRAMNEPEKLDQLLRMKEKGKVRAVGVAHHWEEEFVRVISEYGDDMDYFMFPYNFVHNKATPDDRQNTYSQFMRLAAEHDYGLIGMKPFCNDMLIRFAREEGYIGGPKSRGVNVAPAALRYCFTEGGAHTSLPAMNSVGEIRENVSAVYRPSLTETEKEVLREIDFLALRKKWSYLRPEYRWMVHWYRHGVFSA